MGRWPTLHGHLAAESGPWEVTGRVERPELVAVRWLVPDGRFGRVRFLESRICSVSPSATRVRDSFSSRGVSEADSLAARTAAARSSMPRGEVKSRTLSGRLSLAESTQGTPVRSDEARHLRGEGGRLMGERRVSPLRRTVGLQAAGLPTPIGRRPRGSRVGGT